MGNDINFPIPPGEHSYESAKEENQHDEQKRKAYEDSRRVDVVEIAVNQLGLEYPDRHKSLREFGEYMNKLNAIYDLDRELRSKIKTETNQKTWEEKMKFYKGETK